MSKSPQPNKSNTKTTADASSPQPSTVKDGESPVPTETHEEKRKEQPDLKSETVADGQHRHPVKHPGQNTVDRVIRPDDRFDK